MLYLHAHRLAVLVAFVLAGFILSRPAVSQIHVPSDHATIQQAINAAADGDEIIVAPGTYHEVIDFDGKAVHLSSSDGPEVTAIDADGFEASVVTVSNGEGADTILEGFTITAGTGTSTDHHGNKGIGGEARGTETHGGGMYIADSSPTVTNCIFLANSAGYGGGLFIIGGNPVIASSTFEANTAGFSGGGIRNAADSNPTITDCLFLDNEAANGGGLYNFQSSATVTDCVFEGNTVNHSGGGIRNSNLSEVTVFGCIFESNEAAFGGGLFSSNSSPAELAESTFCHNEPTQIDGPWYDLGGNTFEEFCHWAVPDTVPDPVLVSDHCDEVTIGWPDGTTPPPGVSWYWQGDSCGTTTEYGSEPEFTVSESGTYYLRAKNDLSDVWSEECGSITLHVLPCPDVVSVPEDYATIQAAINAVDDDTTIVVAPGEYFETIDFNGKAVRILGLAGPSVTTLAPPMDHVGSLVTAASDEGPDSILEGFTITEGVAAEGGGMLNVESSPTVINCVFVGNTAIYGAGMMNVQAHPTVIGSTFLSNVAGDDALGIVGRGGGMLNLNSSPEVTDCEFLTNIAVSGGYGGGMYNDGADPFVSDSTFDNNSAHFGGGMYNGWVSNPTVANSDFLNNFAEHYGGGMRNYSNSHATVDDCVFAENSAGFGGGMNNWSSSPTVTDCLFNANDATWSGGGMVNFDRSDTSVSGSTFSGNIADEGAGMFNDFDSMPQIETSEFCENDFEHIDGDWQDLGDNTFSDNCASGADGHFPGDLTGEGAVGGADLGILLSAWGECAAPDDCPADLNGDGTVGGADLGILLSNWSD